MLLLSWKLVKKRVISPLLNFGNVGSMIFWFWRIAVVRLCACCFRDPEGLLLLMVSHIQRFFKLSFWQDRCWENFARSLLMALPENKNHLIFDAFAKTLLTKYFIITWKQRTFQFCLLISTRSREAYTWCFRGKRPTSHQPNRMLMREKGEQRVFLICIPFGSCEVQCLTPIASFWRGHVIFAGVAFGTLIPEDR